MFESLEEVYDSSYIELTMRPWGCFNKYNDPATDHSAMNK